MRSKRPVLNPRAPRATIVISSNVTEVRRAAPSIARPDVSKTAASTATVQRKRQPRPLLATMPAVGLGLNVGTSVAP